MGKRLFVIYHAIHATCQLLNHATCQLLNHVTCVEIKEVKRRKVRAKELEGIDTSNIVLSSRRRSTASFVPTPKPKPPVKSDGDDTEDSDNEDGADDDDDDNDDSDSQSEEVLEGNCWKICCYISFIFS